MDEGPHPATLPPETLLRDCEITRGRGSGPGGQHRNKVQTLVTIRHRPTGVSGSAGERRSQAQNRSVALFRLRLTLAVEVRCPPGNEPSALWRKRLDEAGGRIKCNPEHDDYPALLAEALDHITDASGDVAITAKRLGCSTSQLNKLLRDEPRAMQRVNAMRAERGMHALR